MLFKVFFKKKKIKYLLVNPTFSYERKILPVKASKIDCAMFFNDINASF